VAQGGSAGRAADAVLAIAARQPPRVGNGREFTAAAAAHAA
jgi:hypothetical protein